MAEQPETQPQDDGPTSRLSLRQLLRLTFKTGIIAYITACLMISFFQNSLIFVPGKTLHASPADHRLDHEDVWLTTDDDVQIHGWFVNHPSPRGCILFFHGNAGTIADRIFLLQIWHDLGYSSLIIDYRGYGKSKGSPSEAGLYRDAEAAWANLVTDRGLSPDQIIVFGKSLGGGVAVELCQSRKPSAIVLESTFTSMADLGQHLFPYLPIRWITRQQFNSIEKIGRVQSPVIVLHGTEDQLIPHSQGRRLFEAANEPKALIITPGDHNVAGHSYSDVYKDQFAQTLESLRRND